MHRGLWTANIYSSTMSFFHLKRFCYMYSDYLC